MFVNLNVFKSVTYGEELIIFGIIGYVFFVCFRCVETGGTDFYAVD
jgi:hypothetical protein